MPASIQAAAYADTEILFDWHKIEGLKGSAITGIQAVIRGTDGADQAAATLVGMRVNETGFAAGAQTVITLDSKVASPVFAPGDVIHAVDDAVLGTIKTVDSDTQITLTKANVDAIADSDIVYNVTPIQFILTSED